MQRTEEGLLEGNKINYENIDQAGLEINISRQWTIGPLALEIWWSCQISGGPDVATFVLIKSNTADRIYLLPHKTFENTLQ